MKNKEILKAFVEMNEDEGVDDLLLVELSKLLDKFSELEKTLMSKVDSKLVSLKDSINNERDEKEKDIDRIKSFVTSHIKVINKSLSELEDKFDVSEIDVRRDKREILENISSVNDTLSKSITTLSDKYHVSVKELDTRLSDITKEDSEFKEEVLKLISELRKELDIKTKKTSSGGGSQPLQISVNSVVANVRYADINVINVGATVSNNDTTKKTDITLAAGSGTFSGLQEKSTTIPNNSLQTFAFTHTPKMIFWGGGLQTLTDDYTVSSNSITFTGTLTPQTGDIILNVY